MRKTRPRKISTYKFYRLYCSHNSQILDRVAINEFFVLARGLHPARLHGFNAAYFFKTLIPRLKYIIDIGDIIIGYKKKHGIKVSEFLYTLTVH